MRTASIRIRKVDESLTAVRAGFLSAWKSGTNRTKTKGVKTKGVRVICLSEHLTHGRRP